MGEHRRDPRPQSDHPPPFTVPDRDRKQAEMPQYQWLNPQFADVTGSARPGSFDDGTEINNVAALRITDQYTGEGMVIRGRPEGLVEFAREVLRCAEMVQVQTMQDPALRRLYGLEAQDAS